MNSWNRMCVPEQFTSWLHVTCAILLIRFRYQSYFMYSVHINRRPFLHNIASGGGTASYYPVLSVRFSYKSTIHYLVKVTLSRVTRNHVHMRYPNRRQLGCLSSQTMEPHKDTTMMTVAAMITHVSIFSIKRMVRCTLNTFAYGVSLSSVECCHARIALALC